MVFERNPEVLKPLTSVGGKVSHIERVPNIQRNIDTPNCEVTEGECQPDDCLTQSEKLAGSLKTDIGDIGYSIVAGNSDTQVISSIFDKNFMFYLKNLINQNQYCFSEFFSKTITETKSSELYSRIQSLGKVHIMKGRLTVVQIDNTLIIFNLVTNIYDHSVTNELEYTVHSTTKEELDIVQKQLKDLFDDLTSTEDRYIYIHWYYNTPDGYRYISITDKLYDTFHKEAYPYLDLDRIASDYLERDEPIMVLLGPPGTGKTRLIRYILNTFCNKKNKNTRVMVTSDQQIIERGDLFINFIGSDEQDVLVLEDIDYHLAARKEGNTSMYNFLSISNGLAIGHQRDKKIILSTNLANVKNIDPALLRPGRCFGILETRLLYYDESVELLKKLGIPGELNPKKEYSLAELYNYGKKSGEILSSKKSTGFV